MKAEKKADGTWEVEGLEPWERTFTKICDMLRRSEAFKFARYGDGEIFCMNGKIGRNCDKHEYFPDLGLALHEALKNANYMVGLQPLSISEGHQRGYFDHLTVLNADVLHNASIQHRLFEFVDAMKGRFVVLVGPKHLEKLAGKVFGYQIVIDELNCWNHVSAICDLIQHFHIQDIKVNSIVFLLCAGMSSEVIIDRFKDSEATFIDCGSVFDPYAGVKSRRYHQTLEV